MATGQQTQNMGEERLMLKLTLHAALGSFEPLKEIVADALRSVGLQDSGWRIESRTTSPYGVVTPAVSISTGDKETARALAREIVPKASVIRLYTDGMEHFPKGSNIP